MSDPRRTVVFSTIVKALPLIIGVTVICGAAGILLSRYQAVAYTAESQVVLKATRSFDPLTTSSGSNPARYIANQLAVMESRPVLDVAVATLADGTTTTELERAVELEALADTDVIILTTTAPTAQGAANRANAITAAYAQYVTNQVNATAQAAQEAVAADPLQVAEIAGAASLYGSGIQTVTQAEVPTEPSAPQPLRNGFLLAALGALVSIGAAVVRRGQPLAERGALVEGAGAPVLGVVPVPLPRLRQRKAPPLPVAQDFSMVLVALGYVAAESNGVVMCTGMRDDSGTATVALGLAAAAAEQQHRVVVVDADTRRSGLVRRTGLPGPGLAVGAISDAATPEAGALVELEELRPAVGGGSVHLASVATGATETWGADALRAGLQRLVDSFDTVVLHTGPVATDPMAFALLREAAVVVAVVDERASAGDLLALRDKLDLASAECDGLVLTRPVPTRRRRPAASRQAVTPALLTSDEPAPHHDADDDDDHRAGPRQERLDPAVPLARR